MFRLLGFCIGSLASLGLLFMVIGTPDFHLGDDAEDRARFDEAVEKLKSRQANRTPERRASDEAAEPTRPAVASAPPMEIDSLEPANAGGLPAPPTGGPESVARLASTNAPPASAVEDAVDESVSAMDVPATFDELPASALPSSQAWHSFWTPFRTKVAATGFVGRLENVTGLDYRIVSAGRDGYIVEFSYDDDSEIDSKLDRISAATGLDLSRDLP